MDGVFVTVGVAAICTALVVFGLIDQALRWIGGMDHLQLAALPF